MSDMGVIARDSVYAAMATASPGLGFTSINKVGATFVVPAKTLASGVHAGIYAGDEVGEVATREQTNKTLKTVIRVYSRIDAEDIDASDAFANAVSGVVDLFSGENSRLTLGSLYATITDYEVNSVYQETLNQSSLAVRDIVLSMALVK